MNFNLTLPFKAYGAMILKTHLLMVSITVKLGGVASPIIYISFSILSSVDWPPCNIGVLHTVPGLKSFFLIFFSDGLTCTIVFANTDRLNFCCLSFVSALLCIIMDGHFYSDHLLVYIIFHVSRTWFSLKFQCFGTAFWSLFKIALIFFNICSLSFCRIPTSRLIIKLYFYIYIIFRIAN